MNWFKIKEYYHYRRNAQGRHAVHSPFVYRFVEEALRPPIIAFTWSLFPYVHADGGLGVWYSNEVMRRVLRYFDFRHIALILPDYTGITETLILQKHAPLESGDITFQRALQPSDTLYDFNSIGRNIVVPQDWMMQYAAIVPHIGELDVIAVHKVHESPAYTKAWEALCAQPEVTISIDLFQSGLLFFSKDFKERQHFVLKYPL